MSQHDLDSLRKGIQEIDKQLLELTAERMKLCRKVGEFKRDNNLPVKDYKVEKQIIEKTKVKASALNIYPELAESLIKILIQYSVLEQDEIKSSIKAGDSSSRKNILIIGGAGNMGQWMAHFFESLGHNIRINDEKSSENSRYESETDLQKGLDWAHITVLATPMEQTNDLLRKLSSLPIKGIVVELTSLKSPIQEGLRLAKARGLSVVSTHPMFGPNVQILSGRNFIICDDPEAHNQDHIREIEEIFRLTSAKVIRIPLSQHDELMNYVLGSAHLINLIYANLLETSKVTFKDLESVSGTTFSHQVQVTKSVINENPDLYFDIQKLNIETSHLFEGLTACIDQIKSFVFENKREEFKTAMLRAARFFKE